MKKLILLFISFLFLSANAQNYTPNENKTSETVSWGPYMLRLERYIKRNWNPPRVDNSKRIVVTFVIAKDGRLVSRELTKSSGNRVADEKALLAIDKTAPFEPLPKNYKGQSVPIEFTFDYAILNNIRH